MNWKGALAPGVSGLESSRYYHMGSQVWQGLWRMRQHLWSCARWRRRRRAKVKLVIVEVFLINKNWKTLNFPTYCGAFVNGKRKIPASFTRLTIIGVVIARCPGNTSSNTSLGTSPRYAIVPDQTGSMDGESGRPWCKRRLFRTADLMPSIPTNRSHVAVVPFWNWIRISSPTSSYDEKRCPKWRRPLSPLTRVCWRSALWNVVDPPEIAHEHNLIKCVNHKPTFHHNVVDKIPLWLIAFADLKDQT